MGVLAVQLSQAGLIPNTTGLGLNISQQLPVPIYIETGDTLATALATGYLNKSRADFQFPYNNQQIALVYTTDQGALWLSVVVSGSNYSLQGTTNVSTVYEASFGSAAAPSYTFVGRTTDGLYSGASHELDVALNAINVASFTTGTFTYKTGNIIASTGNLQAGSSGHAGTVSSFPGTASKGSLVLTAVANTGNTLTTISNAAMGQASVVSIPDPGAATANFLINSGVQSMAAGSELKLDKGTGTEAANAVTISKQSGVITTSALTTAGGATYVITLTNTLVATTSVVLLTWMGGTNTTANFTMSATAVNGSSVITIFNNTAATALNGTIIIGFTVL